MKNAKPSSDLLATLGSEEFNVWCEAHRQLVKIGSPIVPQLIRALQISTNDSILRHALSVLREIDRGAIQALPEILRLLNSASPLVRLEAVITAGSIGSAAFDAVPGLLLQLANSDSNLVAESAWALGNICVRAANVVGPLLELAQNRERKYNARVAAIEALARFQSRARIAVPALQRLARTEPELGSSALAAIVRIVPTEEAVAFVAKTLSLDRPPLAGIALALIMLGSHGRSLMPSFLSVVSHHLPEHFGLSLELVANAIGATGFDDPLARDLLAQMRSGLQYHDRYASFQALAALGKNAITELSDSAARGDGLAIQGLADSTAPAEAILAMERLLDEHLVRDVRDAYDAKIPNAIATMSASDELVVGSLERLIGHRRKAVRSAAKAALKERRDLRGRQVLFSAQYPPEIAPDIWYSFSALLYLPAPKNSMSALPVQPGRRARTVRADRPIPHGTEIVVTPLVDGFEFNPQTATVRFLEDVHEVSFRMRLRTSKTTVIRDWAANGEISFSVASVAVAHVPISVFVSNANSACLPTENSAVATSKVYSSVFVSYSRSDTKVVEKVERAASVLGTTFIRDTRNLRAGENWEERLFELIESSDIFQLYWSQNARSSPNVEKEWRHALFLERDHFIRPCYWEVPMPLAPEELSHLHFAILALSDQ